LAVVSCNNKGGQIVTERETDPTQERRTRTLIALFEALPPEQQASVILFAEFLAESAKKT
jgi:hypothetical protein